MCIGQFLRGCALKLAAMLVSMALVLSTMPASASAASVAELERELQQLRDEQQKIKKQQQNNETELTQEQKKKTSYEQEVQVVEKQLENYNQQIQQITAEINQTNQSIQRKDAEIVQKKDEIEQKQREIEENNELFKQRLEAMHVAQTSNSYLSLLLGAESFSDILSATETIRNISKHDQQLLNTLDQQHQALEQLKTELEKQKSVLEQEKQVLGQNKTKLEETKSGFEDKACELQDLLSLQNKSIVEIKQRQGKLELQYEANLEEISETEAQKQKQLEIARKAKEEYERQQKEKQKQQNNNSSSGGGSNSGSSGGSSNSGSSGGSNNGSSGGNSNSGSSGGNSGNQPNARGYIWPVPKGVGYVSSGYGTRWGRLHAGVDIAASIGTSILAAVDGIVVDVQKWDGVTKTGMQSYGNMVRLYHPSTDTYTRYAHCSKTLVSKGQTVKQGDKIAAIGSTGSSTGPHLHFEVSTGVSNTTRVNPLPYIQ